MQGVLSTVLRKVGGGGGGPDQRKRDGRKDRPARAYRKTMQKEFGHARGVMIGKPIGLKR